MCATFLSVLDGFKGLVSDLSLWEGYNVDLENQQVLHVCAEVNRLLEKVCYSTLLCNPYQLSCTS